MLEIIRNGLIITPNGQLDASAGSYDVPVTLTNDDTYSDYVINMFVGWYARGILKKRKAEIDSDGNYLIPKEAFQQNGMINISFLLEKKDKTQGLMTNALGYQVKNAPNVIIEVPADPTWEEIVREWCAELINATIPIISVSKKDGVTTLNITDINGTKTVLIEDGYIPVKGVDYTDGISPIVSVTPITEGSGGYKISITDANGTKTIDILNGSDGSDANVTDENIKKALGFTPAKQEDVNELSREIVDLETETNNKITDLKAQGLQQAPLFAEGKNVNEALEWLEANGDTSKVYLLPNGNIGGYKKVENAGGKPLFTNRLPLAIGSDGEVYNGTGFKTGYRLSSSGAETQASGFTCTGFIPCKNGDVIRLKGVKKASDNNYIIPYNSSFAKNGNIVYGSSIVDDGTGTDTLTYTVAINVEPTYIRISLGEITSDSIITVNEEIVYSEASTGYAWADTGHAFVPADYEDRIIAVETKASSNTSRISQIEERIENGLDEELTDTEKLTKIKYWDKPLFDSAQVTLLTDDRIKPARTSSDKTIDSIYSAYRSLMAQYPEYITETNMGACTSSATFNAVDMLRFDFKEPDGRTNTGYEVYETKPKLIFLSGIHNEWAGVWAVYYALEEITTNPAFADIRRNAHIIVIPCANPYGLTKPLGEYETPSHVNANGVAIHNNFGVDWVLRGSVGAYNYSGTSPYSELETQYIDKVMADNSDAVAFVSCHNCDYDTEHGLGVIWASSATAHMCNISFRVIDKLTNAWLDKYGDTLKNAIETYRTDVVPDWDYRLGKAQFSTSAGTEQLNATKYGIQGVNVEIPRMMKVFSGTTDSSSEVMTHGAEVYTNLMRTILMAYDYTDKEAYYK